MKHTNKKGFTIIELVIVIAVIAILAAILIPTFAGLIKKANLSVDMQVVKQMNTVLQTNEAVSGKPATVVDAKEILAANGCDDFTPADSDNVYYWVGSENRVILWEKSEDDATKGKVTFPNDLAKKYKNDTASVDWADLSLEHLVANVTPTEGQTTAEALLEAITAADTQALYLTLPANSTLDFTAAQNRAFSSALKDASGVGKQISINLNGSTINAVDEYGIDIPESGSLELVNGTFNHKNVAEVLEDSTFAIDAGASLILRNMELNLVAHTGIAPLDDASEVIIDNTVINSDAYFGISTNGMTSRVVRISINNSTINNTVNGGGVGINVNATADVHINDSYVAGYAHALLIRAGHVDAKNTTLETVATSAGIFKYDSFTHFYKMPKIDGAYVEGASETYTWSQANACPGAVLVAGDYAREAESYPGDVDVKLTNVTFKSANTSEVPHCLVAAKLTKNVILTYDGNTNLGEAIMYNYMIPEYFGSITINGEAKTLD